MYITLLWTVHVSSEINDVFPITPVFLYELQPQGYTDNIFKKKMLVIIPHLQ